MVNCEPGNNAAARQVARYAGLNTAQALTAAHADFVSAATALAIELCAKSAQSDLPVIASAQRLFNAGLTVCK
jgi:hypothetical protein